MIPNKIYGDLSLEEREKLFHANTAGLERTTFNQPLSDDELQSFSAEYIRGQIDLKRIEEDAKASADEWKGKIKKKEAELEESLEMISNGSRKIVGVLFKIPIISDGKMAFYDKGGNLIETRPLKDEERQTRAFIATADGTTTANPDERHVEDIAHEDIGPTIAGHAAEPAPGAEGGKVRDMIAEGADPAIFEDVSRSGDGLNPNPENSPVLDAEYEGNSDPVDESAANAANSSPTAEPHGGTENGLPWDHPSHTRVPDSEADKAAEAGAKKKRTPRAPKVKPDAAQE